MAKYDDRNYIGDIDVADPPGTEDLALGDNLMRSIARAIKNAFPNSTGSDAYTGQLSDLNGLVVSGGVPARSVIMWAGDQVTYPDGPDGWTICDGRARKSGDGNTPDLRAKFIIGAQPADGIQAFTPKVGDTGGSPEIDIRSLYGDLVKFTTDEHVLTEDQIGAHSHAMFTTQTTQGDAALGANDLVAYFGDNVGNNRAYKAQPSNSATATLGKTGAAGSGSNQGHSHTFSIDGSGTLTGANQPPFYALLLIQKD